MNNLWKRPQTAADVCLESSDTEQFGRSIRDWQHELRKVSNRKEFARRVADAPPRLRSRLKDGGQCDAYLAAYVEWLSDRAGVVAPSWVNDPTRVADKASYDYPPLWVQSFVAAPGSFRRRKVFTVPENVLNFRRGRPSVSAAHKRQKNAEHQRAHRERVKAKLAQLAAMEGEAASLVPEPSKAPTQRDLSALQQFRGR